MKLGITRVRDAGSLASERIVFVARETTDVGGFLLARGKRVGENVSTTIERVFWFPDKPVAAGDTIVLYSKGGKAKERVEDGRTFHFFYWGAEEPLWQPPFTPVLMRVSNWATPPKVVA